MPAITSYRHYIIPPLHHTNITSYQHYTIHYTWPLLVVLPWESTRWRLLADSASVTMPISRTIFRKSFKPTKREERFTTETLERRWKTRLVHTSVTCRVVFRHFIKTVRSEEGERRGGRTEERDGVKQILTFTKTCAYLTTL